MARRFVALCFALALTPALLASVPKILIVQHKLAKVKDVDLNVEIADFVAQALDESGRVSPIVYEVTDPAYRAAVSAGKIQSKEELSRADAIDAARKLDCNYLMILEAKAQGDIAMSRCELLRAGKVIWRDPSAETSGSQNDTRIEELFKNGKISRESYEAAKQAKGFRRMSVAVSNRFSLSASLKSIARTWSELLNSSAFKGMETHRQAVTPDPSPGQAPLVTPDQVKPKPKAPDDKQLFDSVAEAVKAGRPADAILLLRDAVDAEPYNLPRRRALIKLLADSGYSDMATREAVSGAKVVVDRTTVQLAGARAALDAGMLDSARDQAMAVLTKEPDSPGPEVVLGEISLRKGDFVEAQAHLDKAIAKGGIGDAFGYRAFALACSGNRDSALKDWGSAVKTGGSAVAWATFVDPEVARLFKAASNIIPRLAVKSSDREADAQHLHRLKDEAEALAALLGTIVPESKNAKSHGRRVLAMQLLSQCLGELEGTLTKPDDEVFGDARINLGEAIKQWDTALTLFKSE